MDIHFRDYKCKFGQKFLRYKKIKKIKDKKIKKIKWHDEGVSLFTVWFNKKKKTLPFLLLRTSSMLSFCTSVFGNNIIIYRWLEGYRTTNYRVLFFSLDHYRLRTVDCTFFVLCFVKLHPKITMKMYPLNMKTEKQKGFTIEVCLVLR